MSQIIRSEQDGVELFTVQATGESGMSQSGLAILAGVTKQSINALIKGLNPSGKTPSESLKPWVGNALSLSSNTEKQGGEVQILKSEFCAAVIQHYAFAGNKVAQFSLTRFAGMGIDKWIQQQTGWDSTLTDLQSILLLAQNALAQHQQQHEELAARTDTLEELVHQHDGEVDRIFHPDGKYFSVRGYARKLKQQVSKQEASEKGRAAAKISRQLGIAIDKLEDPRYGEVNIYHESILEQVF
jgi:DNA-binding XRE family transcriptional regulator